MGRAARKEKTVVNQSAETFQLLQAGSLAKLNPLRLIQTPGRLIEIFQ
jgi:hypothetical protein